MSADYRINIGHGAFVVTVYCDRKEAELTMHNIIRFVTEGDICIEEKTETWTKLPT